MRSKVQAFIRSLDPIDTTVARRLVESLPAPTKSGLAHLSNAANKSKLWIAIAVVQAVAGGRAGRRAARRGLLSVGVTSLIVNAVLKPLFPRPRPPVDPTALPSVVERPASSSFPSGHAASAAAFAVANALEAPAFAAPVAALAAGVAVSRVTSGVHYPSDVVVGGAIGAAIALGSTWVWPTIDASPVDARPAPPLAERALADVSDTGAGLVVVANAASGPDDSRSDLECLRTELPEAKIIEADADQDLLAVLATAATEATVLGVLGGDGTVSAAATVAVENDVPLAVFPGGTLNHFARDLGVDSLDESIAAVKRGEVVRIDTGTIDGRMFVNTASFGSYSEFVESRQRFERHIGKWPAMLFALAKLLVRGEPTALSIDGEPRIVWMIFIGNGAYDPPGFAPASRTDLADGVLDVRIVDGSKPGSRLRLVAALLTGRLGRCAIYERTLRPSLEVDFGTDTATLAADGEIFEGAGRFCVDQRPGALHVIVPPRTDED